MSFSATSTGIASRTSKRRATATGGSITRQTKKSDLRGTRDEVALEAKLASL